MFKWTIKWTFTSENRASEAEAERREHGDLKKQNCF